jgi:hypothetical protein
VANRVLAGTPLAASENDYDWLGHGVYFWQANPRRALRFAEEKRTREKGRWKPAVIGAVIELGLCLDLTTQAGIDHTRGAYESLAAAYATSGLRLPTNSGGKDLFLRKLDCAVIETLHDIRELTSEPPIDTVSGIFLEGEPIYETAGFYEKTHIQVCVRNPLMIKGIFAVSDDVSGE